MIVVNHGRIDERAIHYERVTTEEVLESARSQGIEELGAVRWGVLEPDGTFSFLLDGGQSGQQARSAAHSKSES